MLNKKISLLPFFHVLLCLFALSACNGSAPQAVTISGKTMGTTYTVKYLAPKAQNIPESQQIQADLDNILQNINKQMSTYQPDSEISRFNRMPANMEGINISDDFAQVIQQALQLHQITEGALDITIGPLVNLWGFGPDKTINSTPTSEQINQASKLVGTDKIRLSTTSAGNVLTKQADGVYLDLSAIAKGFGVDKLAEHLHKLGIRDYLVEIGGELRAQGKNHQNQAWKIGIEQPQFAQKQAAQIIVPLQSQALATSGSYRNFRTDAITGKRLSHIINPKSKQPISHNLASISVIADTAATADGLATGLFVLGADKALEIAVKNHLAVFLIIKTDNGFETKMSPVFQKIIQSTP